MLNSGIFGRIMTEVVLWSSDWKGREGQERGRGKDEDLQAFSPYQLPEGLRPSSGSDLPSELPSFFANCLLDASAPRQTESNSGSFVQSRTRSYTVPFYYRDQNPTKRGHHTGLLLLCPPSWTVFKSGVIWTHPLSRPGNLAWDSPSEKPCSSHSRRICHGALRTGGSCPQT